MDKYINKNPETDVIINVELVCKVWDDSLAIHTWIDDKEEEYTLVRLGCSSPLDVDFQLILKSQAIEIVNKLGLVHVRSVFTSSGGYYVSKAYAQSEIIRLTNSLDDSDEDDIDMLNDIISSYSQAISPKETDQNNEP
jgi:hypothetical protein